MASAGVDTTTQGPTPSTQGNGEGPTGGNTAPVGSVESPGAQQEGPSIQETSAALAAASEPGSTQETSEITPRLLAEKGAERVRENIHPFFKVLHNILKIFRFFTPRGLVEWFVERMKKKGEMSREATPA